MARALDEWSIKPLLRVKNMLCVDDMWSFEEGVLAHLAVVDAISLALTCKYLASIILRHCKTCRHLPYVSTDEIPTVTDTRIFPCLQSFDALHLTKRMDVQKLRKLFRRWTDWNSCTISTHAHTRKALRMWLTRIQSVESLTLIVSARHSLRMINLKNALQCFVRRNPNLQHLHVKGLFVPSLLTPFRRLKHLEEVHLTTHLQNCAELARIVVSMPHTVKALIVHNISVPCYVITGPYFLDILALLPHLDDICLIDCLPGISCDCERWHIVRRFCEETRASRLTFSVLRSDCVEALLRRRLTFLRACIIGVPQPLHDLWRTKIVPPAWDVRFV